MMWNLVDDDTVSIAEVRAAFEAWKYGVTVAATGERGGARALLEGDAPAPLRAP